MTPPGRIPPLASWGLVAATVLTGAALLVTAWATYDGVRHAASTLTEAQVAAFERAIRIASFGLRRVLTDEELEEVLEAHAGEGLHYACVLGGDGRVMAEAGEPIGGGCSAAELPSPNEIVKIGDRVRVVVRGGPPPHARRRLRPFGIPAAILLELEPRQADQLRSSAARTLGVGTIAALVLLAGAFWLVRWRLLQEAIERELERERRLASLGRISAVLAHEIRNPLASLKGNAQLLVTMLPPGEKTHGKASRLVEEAVRLEALTNDLLEFARTGELHRSVADPAVLLREAVQAVGAGAITVEAARAPASWPVDAARLRQALVNLLDNAVQAGTPVRAVVAHEARRLVFEIRDSGPGVPEEDLSRIFEPFYTRRTLGTGLGLAVVKRVVELHGGTISVTNEAGGGACFRLVMPEV